MAYEILKFIKYNTYEIKSKSVDKISITRLCDFLQDQQINFIHFQICTEFIKASNIR